MEFSVNKMKKFELFILLLVFLFIGCNNKSNVIKKVNTKDVELKPTINGFSLLKIKNGKISWKIEAQEAVIDDKEKIIKIKNGNLKIYNTNNQKINIANIKFASAEYDTNTENIMFLGKNIINTVENEKIIAYDINYIYKDNKIYSEKEIEINKDGNIIKGIGFETLDGFQTIRIYKNVITTQ